MTMIGSFGFFSENVIVFPEKQVLILMTTMIGFSTHLWYDMTGSFGPFCSNMGVRILSNENHLHASALWRASTHVKWKGLNFNHDNRHYLESLTPTSIETLEDHN